MTPSAYEGIRGTIKGGQHLEGEVGLDGPGSICQGSQACFPGTQELVGSEEGQSLLCRKRHFKDKQTPQSPNPLR